MADREREQELLRALLVQARADRDRLQRRNLELEHQASLLRRVPLLPAANKVRREVGRRRRERVSPPPVRETGVVRPGRYLDVTVLSDPARSGIARVVLRLAAETGYRPIRFRDGCYRHDSTFDAEIHGTPPRPANDDGAALGLGPGVTVVCAAIQLTDDYPAWQDEIAALRAAGGAYVQIVHDLLPITLPDFFDLGMRERFPDWLKVVADEADLILTDSAATRDDLLGWCDRDPATIEVLPLGCDPAPAADRSPVAGRLLVVGTIEPRKAVDVVLDAVAELRAGGHDLTLVLVGGKGWSDEGLFDRIDAAQARGWVRWLRDCDDDALAREYATADLLIAASRGEGFGLPVAEAMAVGLRVVARDLPVFRELLGQDGTYFALDWDLPRAITRALAAPPVADPPTLTTWKQSAAALDESITVALDRAPR